MPEDKNVGRVFKEPVFVGVGEANRFVVILGRGNENWYWVLTSESKIYKYRATWVERMLAQDTESAGAKIISLHPITGIPL